MLYLRPGNLFKEFHIEKKSSALSSRGRAKSVWEETGSVKAILSKAAPDEEERFNQFSHPISHMIAQKGKAQAQAMDRLVHGNRVFYVRGVDEPGGLGLWTVYYVEERSDTEEGRGERAAGEEDGWE